MTYIPAPGDVLTLGIRAVVIEHVRGEWALISRGFMDGGNFELYDRPRWPVSWIVAEVADKAVRVTHSPALAEIRQMPT